MSLLHGLLLAAALAVLALAWVLATWPVAAVSEWRGKCQ